MSASCIIWREIKLTVSSVCVNRTDVLDRVENNLLQIIVLWKPCTYWTVHCACYIGSGTFHPKSISSHKRFAPRTFRLWLFRPWTFCPYWTFRPPPPSWTFRLQIPMVCVEVWGFNVESYVHYIFCMAASNKSDQ